MRYHSSPRYVRKPLVVAIQNAFLGLTACCTVFYPVGMAYAGTSETSAAFTATQVVRQFTLRNTVAQANEALQAQVLDDNGTLKGAAMGSYGVLAADMGTVPTGFGVPQRDGAGRQLGYCAWDNATGASSVSTHRAGTGAYVYAVVSAGLNGAIESTCAGILSTGTGAGDDYVQVRVPAKVSATTFKTAVSTSSALPAGAEGDIRLVLDTNTLYSYKTGTGWAPVKAQGAFNDDGSGNLNYSLGTVTVAAFEATTGTFSSNVTVGGTTTLTGALTANNGITVANGLAVSSGGANITGNANITGTLTVGSNTTVTGTVTATNFSGNGSALTNLNASNISSGTLGVARGGTGVDASAAANGALLIGNGSGFGLGTLTGTANQVNVTNAAGSITLSLPQNIATTSTPTFGGMTLSGALSGATTGSFSGAVTAASFSGSGSGLTGLNASNISSGTLGVARGGTGVDASAAANGALLIGNGSGFGLGTLTGTANQVNVTNAAGSITLSLPQSIATTSTPTFGGMTLSGALSGTSGAFSNDLVIGGSITLNRTGLNNPHFLYGPSGKMVFGETYIIPNETGGVAQFGSGSFSKNMVFAISKTNVATTFIGTTSSESIIGSEWSNPISIRTNMNYNSSNILATGTEIIRISPTGVSFSVPLSVTGGLSVSGIFTGNGSGLTSLNASNIASGTLGTAFGGTGVTATPTNGQLLIGNGSGFGLGTLTGTANQVNVTNAAGSITLSLPQSIATTSTPTFGGMTLSGALSGATTGSFSGAVTAASFSGSGSGLTGLNASNISSGTLGVARGGTGVDASAAANGALLIGNGSGFTLSTLTGTTNQVTVTNSAGGITLSLPQSIATTSTPTFGGMTLTGALTGTTATYSGNVTAQRLLVGDSSGSVSSPNIVIGSGSMAGTPSGTGGNIAVGINSLVSNTSGYRNIAFGRQALNNNSTGFMNLALGYSSLGSQNTGNYNAALGVYGLTALTSGNQNTSIGAYALDSLTSGSDNVGIGTNAGKKSTDPVNYVLTSGNNNTFIGSSSAPAFGITSLNNATAIGAYAEVGTSSTVVLGRTSDTTVIGATGTASSGTLLNRKLQVTGDIGSTGTLYAAALNISGNTTLSGTVTATSFSGDGSALTNLDAGDISSGTLGTARGGTGVSAASVLNGQLLIGNGTGFTLTNLTGTSNQVVVTNSSGGITLSLPQNIATTSTPTFGGMTLNGALSGTAATFSGAVTAASFSGNGSSLTNLNASNISSGTLGVARGGTGVDASAAANGALLIGNGSGFTLSTLTGTTNQVTVTNSAGGITLSLPQNIATTSTPTFGGLTISGRMNIADSTGVSLANVVVGTSALSGAQSGTGANTAVGSSVLNANTSGNHNTGVGRRALVLNTTGSTNVAVGSESLKANTTGSKNVALGYSSLDTNTTGSNNTALGFGADTSDVALTYATALGADALVATSSTVVLGRTSDTTVIGATGTAGSGYMQNTKLQVTGSVGVSGTIYGTDLNMAGSATITGTLTANRLVALDPGSGLTVGNVVVGSGNFNGTQTGYGANIAMGVNALASNTSGATNIAIGEGAMYSNTSGLVNTAVGGNALYSNTTEGANAAFGYWALESATTGYYNAAFGAFALDGLITGNQNTGVGVDAGSYFADANYLLTGGSNNTFLGSSSSPASGVHTLNYATVVGSEAKVGTDNTVVLGRTVDKVVIGATGTASSGNLSGKTLQLTGTLGVSGAAYATSWNTWSDRRLKTDFLTLGDDILSKLSALNAYEYRYIDDATGKRRNGVIAQELAALFPNVVMSDSSGYLSVDYGALGAIAAAGVGKLNKQFIALNGTVTEQGKKLTTLETKVNSMDERVLALEGWRVAATTRMDTLQKAIDLNIEKIAEHALKIAANEEKITKLETVVGKIDERVTSTESRLDKVEGKWASTFSVSADGQSLTVQAPHLIAANFTAQQLKVKAAYTERLEAEMARIRELEVNNLRANTASAQTLQAGSVQAATVNTGSLQVFASAGLPVFLFSAPEDGHYTVNTSATDGSYASATVIVNMGQVRVVTFKSEGIELIGDGNTVKLLSNGKMIRASWTKTG